MPEQGQKRTIQTQQQRAERYQNITESAKQIIREDTEARQAKSRRLKALRTAKLETIFPLDHPTDDGSPVR